MRKFILLILFVGCVYYIIDYFDIHVQEFDSVLLEQINERKNEAGSIRNEEIWEQRESVFEGTASDIVVLVNLARKDAGVSDLKTNTQLMESAMLKAEDMKEKDYFDHMTPEGLDMSYFVNVSGYNFSIIGENLAEGYFSAQSVHDALMKSPGHKENVLSADYEDIGIAVVEIEREGNVSFLSVQHFGTKLKEITKQPTQEVTVCDKKIKKNCKNAKENREEVKDIIEKQEDIIDDAKEKGFPEKVLRELDEDLEKLEEIKDDLKVYLKDCEKMFDYCDEWD
ncbi:MAG: CAP domain-containing protein [Patescibacteria group bacterium]|nr:CAP domain-containing protein [Patescibacteria group bacterium]